MGFWDTVEKVKQKEQRKWAEEPATDFIGIRETALWIVGAIVVGMLLVLGLAYAVNAGLLNWLPKIS